MNFNYKHIIWDWNGTLIDDAGLCHEIINEMLTKRGIAPISFDTYREVFNFPVVDFYTKIGFNFDIEPFHIPAAEYIDEYNACRFRCSLRGGVPETLSFFKDADITQSILSASKKTSLEEAVGYYGLRTYFMDICGLDDHYAHSKIELGREHLVNLGIAKKDAVIIGDTTHDYEVASSLGIDCILIAGGHHHKERLEACGVAVLDAISDLKKLISAYSSK